MTIVVSIAGVIRGQGAVAVVGDLANLVLHISIGFVLLQSTDEIRNGMG